MTDDPIAAARAGLERIEGAARDQLSAAADAAEAGLESTRDFIERQAREHPLTTIGVALGVGVVLGLLLTSGRRD
jgi:ElaB/YqjD/DUF883 family membrane-anchored ribosome-binding protein